MTHSKPLATSMALTRAPLLRLVALILVVSLVSGCNTFRRLAELGEPPKMSPVSSPTESPGYRRVALPMPTPRTAERNANSLWRPGANAFFKDNRANNIGDIITVVIDIEDSAAMENKTELERGNTRNLGIPQILGFETETNGWLPEAFDPTNAVNIDSEVDNQNGGNIDREEKINLKVAAIITQILPNGNMVLHGRQQMRVNYEMRELEVGGVIRPEDISNANTISFEQIAEARVAYGGRGSLSDRQTPPWGEEMLDIFLPF